MSEKKSFNVNIFSILIEMQIVQKQKKLFKVDMQISKRKTIGKFNATRLFIILNKESRLHNPNWKFGGAA